jgi:hypothetical protein
MDSPSDIETLKAELAAALLARAAEAERATKVEAELALARAKLADDAATIAAQKLEIAKLNRRIYGPRSERAARLIDQMELALEELEAAATEDEIAAEQAAARTTNVTAFTRKRPSRQPFPAHLPRERVVVPGSPTCACCGGSRLRKLGETVSARPSKSEPTRTRQSPPTSISMMLDWTGSAGAGCSHAGSGVIVTGTNPGSDGVGANASSAAR